MPDQANIQDKIIGRLHSMETMGLVDGPGIRTIFFLQGCPLRCRYCHNPDTQAMTGGREISPQEILQYAKRYKPYHGQDGGITFSGGEPLVQGKFLAACLKLLKENGFTTCLDTSAYGQKEYYPQIFPYVDTILLDIKSFTDDGYKNMVFGSIKPVLDFMNNLDAYGFNGLIWIRHVMVPGYTDNKESMKELVKIIKPIQHRVERLEILPYHTAGIAKYEELGMTYKLPGVEPMDPAKAKEFEIYANELLAEQMSLSRHEARLKQLETYHKSEERLENRIKEKLIELERTGENMKNASKQEVDAKAMLILDDLANHPLFKHLHPKVFEDIKSELIVMDLDKDQTIFTPGDKPDYMYVIYSGAVKIFTLLADDQEQILYIYRKGDFVGGHNLLSHSPYWYTGVAMLESVVVAIPSLVFEAYFASQKPVLKEVLSKSFERIRWAEDLINRLATLNSSVKTAGLILRLAESAGEIIYDQNGHVITVNDKKAITIPLAFDRSELSNFSGMTRESLTRKLGEFESLGYIKLEHGELTILNLAALEAYLD